MKKVFVFTVIVFLALGGVAMAQKLTNSKHDLGSGSSASIKASDTTEICVFCHVPHHQGTVGTASPLWNHTATTTNLTWNPTTTLRGTTLPTDITSAALQGAAACLSCHDGTIALGSVLEGGPFTVSGTGTTGGKLSSAAKIDTSKMSTNHPVGVAKPANGVVGFSDFKQTNPNTGVWYRLSSTGSTEYVQCQSCHNPHLTTNSPFLRISNASSAICKSCHDM